MFPSRKKPPDANFHSEGSRSCNDNDTSRKSARRSLWANDTSSSELEHSKTTPGTDGPRASFELCHLRGQLAASFTANAKPFSDASVQMQTSSQRSLQSLRRRHRSPPKALDSIRTVDHGSPETNYDARANLKLASRTERAPRLVSAKKDS